jgi:uncharacterized protein YwqG
MNILTKILNLFRPDKLADQNSQIFEQRETPIESIENNEIEDYIKTENEKVKRELERLNLSSAKDLENLISKLILPATKIEIQKPTNPPENSQLISHFGGHPYFEEGEEWVKSKNGNNMTFVFQIFNNEQIELPRNIELIQFYYDFDAFPWDTDDDGWRVKIYEKLNIDKRKIIENPFKEKDSKYCEIVFKPIESMPDWDGIFELEPNAANLSVQLDSDNPSKNFRKTVEKLVGEQDYQSQLGGYPKWVQSDATPTINDNKRMNLLFQIDSEENPGLMWGDVGLVYVFYDEETKRIEYTLQCH